jgi:hypothetical protein
VLGVVAMFGRKVIYRTKKLLVKFENIFFNGKNSREQIFYSVAFFTLPYDWKGLSTVTCGLAVVLIAL